MITSAKVQISFVLKLGVTFHIRGLLCNYSVSIIFVLKNDSKKRGIERWHEEVGEELRRDGRRD